MNIQDVLDFAEQLLKEKTGKGLTQLQREILQRAWDKETYADFSDDNSYSYSYVRTVGAELFKLFSEALEKQVKKRNFRDFLENLENLQIYICSDNNNNNDNTNLTENCIEIKISSSKVESPHHQHQKQSPIKNKFYYDLRELPRKTDFYGRIKDLELLQTSITNYQLINLYGLKGIGKTSLIVEFVEQAKKQFPCIIYKSLAMKLSREDLEIDLIESINNLDQGNQELDPLLLSNPKKRCDLLLNLLENVFCLIIFDDVHDQEFYEFYGSLFEQFANLKQKGCVILISNVKINNLLVNSPIFSFHLQGLDQSSVEIMLTEMGFNQCNLDQKFLANYQGHPFFLKQVAPMIKEFFNGDFSSSLLHNTILITDLMKTNFKHIFDDLSSHEKQIIMILVKQDQPISLTELLPKLSLSLNELIIRIKSLGDRSLIEVIQNTENSFSLIPVLREYVRNIEPN